MHFGFAIDLSDIDLWNIDLLDTPLDLLDIDITSKNFVCLPDVFKTSSRRLQDMSSRCLQDMSSRHLQRNNFLSSKTSWRRLEDVLEGVKLLRWRRVEDVCKTSWRPTNVCWDMTRKALKNSSREVYLFHDFYGILSIVALRFSKQLFTGHCTVYYFSYNYIKFSNFATWQHMVFIYVKHSVDRFKFI